MNPQPNDERELLLRHYLTVQEQPLCTIAYLDYLARLYERITWEGLKNERS